MKLSIRPRSSDGPILKRCFSLATMWMVQTAFIALAGTPVDLLWVRSGEGSPPVRAAGVAADGNGNAYMMGVSGATEFGKSLFLAKYDRTGSLLWVRNVAGRVYHPEGESTSWGNKLAVDKSGNAYVTENASAGGTGDIVVTNILVEAFVAKYDTTGNLMWFRAGIGGISSSIAVNDREDICLTGISGNKIFTMKRDSKGDLIWVRYAGDGSLVSALGVAADRFGNAIITGSFQQKIKFGDIQLIDGSGGDIFVAKYDPDGTHVWARGGEGPSNSNTDRGTSVAVNSEGDIYVTGSFQGNASFAGGTLTALNFSGSHLFVAKLDSAGNLKWILQSAPSSNGTEGMGIAVDIRGDAYVTGIFGGTERFGGSIDLRDSGLGDVFIAKYSGAGNLLWVKQAGGKDGEYGRSIAADYQGNAYLIGEFGLLQTNSSATFGQTSLIARGKPDVFLLKTGVAPVLVNDQIGYSFDFKVTNSSPKSVQVRLQTRFDNGTIFYTLDGSRPSFASAKYVDPIAVDHSVILRMVAYDTNFNSDEFDPVPINFLPSFLKRWSLGGGMIEGNPPNDFFREDTVVQLTAVPDAGWTFLNWSGDATGTSPVIMVTMERSKAVEAIFGTAIKTNIVGSGSVLLTPQLSVYPFGTTLRVIPVPSRESFFALWGGSVSGNDTPLVFNVTTANPTLSALFSPLEVGQSSLVVLTTGKGSVKPIPKSNVYISGQAVTLMAIPEPGNEFLFWGGDAVGNVNPLVIVMSASKLITANFTSADSPLRIDTARFLSKGAFRLEGVGEAGHRVRIQTSANLVNWTDLTMLISLTGKFEFTDMTANPDIRFYRIIGD